MRALNIIRMPKKTVSDYHHTIPESGFSDINPMQVVLQCSGVYGILSVIAQIQDGLTFLSILLLEGY